MIAVLQFLCRITPGDWPQFHGSGSDGHVVGLAAPMEWSDSKHVAWKSPRSVAARINHSFVTPTVAIVDGTPQVLAPGPDHLAA